VHGAGRAVSNPRRIHSYGPCRPGAFLPGSVTSDPRPLHRPRRRGALIGLLALTVTVVVLLWPVETRVGLDYSVSKHRIHLYEKGIHFLSRHLQARRLAADITQGGSGPEERILAIFRWVDENVRPTPPGFPVVDDHILHIIIRGHGATDQRTEAFALLASYAGMPAGPLSVDGGPIFAGVRIGDDRYLFDVVNGVAFFRADGSLATVRDLMEDAGLVAASTPPPLAGSPGYGESVAAALRGRPNHARIAAQMPWSRLRHEASVWPGERGR